MSIQSVVYFVHVFLFFASSVFTLYAMSLNKDEVNV